MISIINAIQFRFRKIILLIFCLILFFSCTIALNKSDEQKQRDSERLIDISDVKVELPAYNGLELVESNCVPCHSLRYIEMQPEMSKKSWEKIVFKMIKNFDAPIKDSLVANQIIEYLYAIRGTK